MIPARLCLAGMLTLGEHEHGGEDVGGIMLVMATA